MAKVSLLDVVRPYFFVGIDLGPGVHDVLDMLHVDELDSAVDDDGVVIWGIARIDTQDARSPVFSPAAGGGPVGQPAADGWLGWEWHDVAVRFRLTAPRRAAESLVSTAVTDPDVRAVIEALGPTTGPDRSDYPGTQFRLELLFDLVSVRIPKLIGARLDGWLLVPDPDHRDVKIALPNVALVLTQDSAGDTSFDVDLGGFGAETFDGLDPAVANLVQMTPPYALVPGERFGFGLQQVVLDLSADSTPPDMLDKFGIGDDWKGLYLPEARIFWSTQKSAGTAFHVVGRELMIGFSPSFGVWGDLSFDVDVVGDRLDVKLRLYAVSGARTHAPSEIPPPDGDEDSQVDRYMIRLTDDAGPDTENYLLFVDVVSGSAPFTITALHGLEHPEDLTEVPSDAAFDDPANSPEDMSVMQRTRLFSVDQRVAIRVVGRNPTQKRVIVLDVYPDYIRKQTTAPKPPKPVPPAVLTPPGGAVRIAAQTADDVILAVEPPESTLTIDGVPQALTDGAVRVPVPQGADLAVVSSFVPVTNPEIAHVDVYFRFDDATTMYASPVRDGTPAPADLAAFAELYARADASGPTPTVFVAAYASAESSGVSAHNQALTDDRAALLASAIEARLGIAIDPSHVESLSSTGLATQGDARLRQDHLPGAAGQQKPANQVYASTHGTYDGAAYRKAVARAFVQLVGDPVVSTYALTRDAVEPDPVPEPDPRPQEPPAPQGQHPAFLRHLGGTLRFERDIVPIAGELRLTVDYATAHEEGLEKFREDIDNLAPGLEDPEEGRLPSGNPNPEDGVVEFRFALTHDPATGTFHETLVARAAEADRDGLWSWGSIPAADTPGEPTSDGWRDLLGLYLTFAPLLAETASEASNDGAITPLVASLATPVLLTTLGVAHVLRITHYGVELDVTIGAGQVETALLFDVEMAVWVDLSIAGFEIVKSKADKPVKIRYKAVGFGLEAGIDAPTRFYPVFDAARGYTLDLADSGSLKVLPQLGDTLGDIVQVLGAKIARTNPLNLEVELGLATDLGVVTVDTFGFRLPIDPLGTPTITSLGVSLDIEGAVHGAGYLAVDKAGFKGALDVTLPTVGLRAAASLAIAGVTEGDRRATGLLAGIEVELPTGIPLAGTGLMVFGFLGLFAMHHRRLENPGARIPALDWLVNVVHGDPTDPRGWGPALDAWALGVGLVAGTVDGGTVMNLKGLLSVEVPGPRVLVFANARVFHDRPSTRSTDTGTLLAVVDVNPQRVLIGLRFEHHIERVLDLVVPIEAGFFYDPPTFPPEHFYVDVGTIARPVTAKILSVFDATAYLMVHGDGIPDFPLGPLSGFSLATGFRTSLLWGSTSARLYLRVAAGFDAGIGFQPLWIAGRVFIEGDLRLFIVTISASGALRFDSNGVDARLEGEVCGRVDFWFFSVKGCVRFAVGPQPGVPAAPPLVRDLTLQSRSPALVEGTGVDRGIDTVLCRGTTDGSVPQVDVRDGDALVSREVRVPIDAVPLVTFEVGPELAGDATIDGQLSSGLPPGFAGGWRKRGPNYVRYELHEITLRLVSRGGVAVPPGTSPVTEGPRPYTWRHGATGQGGDGMPVELALLDWKPTDVDKALVMGPALDSLVDGVWGSVCTPVAEAAAVLWTFGDEDLGPSPAGWALVGTPWPDAPGTTRSAPPPVDLRVNEPWRTGTLLDGIVGTTPAEVVGGLTPCPKGRTSSDVTASPGILAPPKDLCLGKLLEAPYELVASDLAGVLGQGPLLDALLDLDGQRKEDLRDVVRVTGAALREVTLLAYARNKMVVSDMMRVRAFGADGASFGEVSSTWTRVDTDADLPPRWTDAEGPWAADVALARALRSALLKTGIFDEYVVTVKLPAPAVRVDIGLAPLADAVAHFGLVPPSWYLAVVEGLAEAERQRADADQAATDADADGLEDALGDQTHALLLPDARYEVFVRYDAFIGAKPVEPEEGQDPDEIVELGSNLGATSTLTFYTDANAPRNLDPWMLCQFPAPGDGYHFTDDPVVLVFATDDVLELFATYDRELRAVARAASFRGSAETPEAPLTHLALASRFERVGGVVLSPWETTVRRRIGGFGCRDFDPDADRHGRATLPFLLDPLTDYVLDLEALRPDGSVDLPPVAEGDAGRRPLFRRSFTTSRFASRAQMAEQVRVSRVVDRALPDVTALAALPDQPTDERFDAALLDAGLPLSPRPDAPRITILWTTDPVPQPFALLIETPEPVWRSRLEPEPEHDPSGVYITAWRMQRREWLLVDELVRANPAVLVIDGGDFVRRSTGTRTFTAPTTRELRDRYVQIGTLSTAPPAPPAAAKVARFVRDASGTRTLAVLATGARGATVSLGLARRLHPLLDLDATDTPVVLCEVELASAPWEET